MSRAPLETAQRQTIESDLAQRYGAGISVSYQVDPTLIGGLILRVGDQVLDNSLRTRLSAIQRNMLSS